MNAKSTVIGSLAWTVGFLVSAVALKGNPIGDWIEGGLLVGWIVFVSLAARSPRRYSDEKNGAR